MALPNRPPSPPLNLAGRAATDSLQLITDAALAHGDIMGILPEVVGAVCADFQADTAVLLLAGDSGRDATINAVTGLLAADLASGQQFPMVSGSAGRLIEQRQPVRIESVIEAGSVASVQQLRAQLGAGMVVDSHLLGTLHLGWLREGNHQKEFRALQNVADRIALTLDHARLYRSERIARSDAARAERRFRDLVQSLDAIVWEIDASDWRFTFVSRRAEKMLGYPLQEWLDTPDFWQKLVHPDDRDYVVRRRRDALEKGKGGALEYRVRTADGRTLWMQGLFEIVRDLAGVPRQLRGLMLDVTQRHDAEEDALRLAAIIEGSEDAIIGKDLDGVIRTWNFGAEKMYGYTAQEVVGRHISFLTPAHLSREIGDIMTKLRAGQRISHLETQRQRKDGQIIDVALTISPIRDSSRRTIIGASTIAREITDMKRAERTLRTTEKLAATGRLAASIAHEINNPMASVTNLLYLLQHHGTLDTTAAEYVKLAQEELQRVTHIVRQMLGFYRESETPIPVSLKDVIENVILLYSRRLQNTRIQVERSYKTDAVFRGFPGEIRQVFSNLIVNAIEALADHGRIRIDVRRSRDWSQPEVIGVRVLIADDGPGIPEAARRRIFEPFFTTKGERGTGLGLWVSEGIVRKHGGLMRVRSHTGPDHHGTCFSLFFPLDSPRLPH